MCLVTFDKTAGTGVLVNDPNTATSGIFELLGYSTTVGGTYGANPVNGWPNTTQNYGDSVDTATIEEGFYKFKYKSTLAPTDPCYGEMEFILPVVQGTDSVGSDQVIDLCSGDAARNIFTDSGLYALASVNPVAATIGGAGLASPGYSDNATSGDITDDTFDPSQESSYPATVVFEITYTPQTPAGYSLSSCTSCQAKTLTITYNITENFNAGAPSNVAMCSDG